MATNHDYRKVVLDNINSIEGKCRQALTDIYRMAPGAARRAALLAWLLQGRAAGETRKVFVNRRWTIILKYDKDLQQMLKKGVLVRRRGNAGRCSTMNKRTGSFHTYLTLADGYAP